MLSYQTEVPTESLHAFVQAQPMGRLITVDEQGFPRVSLFNFVFDGESFALHLPRHHPQLRDLAARPECLFSLDEVLAMIPSHWVDEENGGLATAYYRQASFRCQATVSGEPEVLGPILQRLMDRHQPEGGYKALDPQDPLYQGAFKALVAVVLKVEGQNLKFKHGQNRTPEKRQAIIEHLKARALPGDGRAAEAVAWTLAPG